MPKSLQARKRQLVRDAIYDAAIELFAKKGFDETTVEEVADAAGISRRSFFRYFESKDDLLALNTVHCGEILCETVTSCPANLGPLDVVHETVLAAVKFTEAQKHAHQIVEIAQRSISARQAHQSRMMEIRDRLASAYSVRLKISPRDHQIPQLLAGVCQLAISAATASWFFGEHKDLDTATKQAFLNLRRLFCDESAASSFVKAAPASKMSASNVPKKSQNKKK
jgi:AcrR family transcriptional regulator